MTSGPEGWLAPLRGAGAGHEPVAVLGTLARHLAAATGSRPVQEAVDRAWPVGPELSPAALPAPAGALPDALGWAYESLADRSQRRRGLHYTPRAVADRLVAVALDGIAVDGPVAGHHRAVAPAAVTVCDPACGGGAFLLAAARWLAGAGVDRRAIVDRCVVGVDVDPVAVAVATTTLRLWAAGDPDPGPDPDADTSFDPDRGGEPNRDPRADRDLEPDPGVAVPLVGEADALAGDAWPYRPAGGFDVVVGNPPFQSQLGSATARAGEEISRLRAALGEGASGYVDTAALFLLAAVSQVRPGGRILLIQPQSVLGARDAAPLRRRLDRLAPLEGLWVCDEPVFAAATRVCAPVLRVEAEPDPAIGSTASEPRSGAAPEATVRRWRGPEVESAASADRPEPGMWAELAADLRGIPAVALGGTPLPDAGPATAGFRDQYYGLVGHVHEATGAVDERPLVTSGLIEPAECAWGRRVARFAKVRWRAPVVELATLAESDPALARWVGERLVPKVVVAAQTRVIEVAVDVEGRWVPSTPVISVPVVPERLWHVAAALSAPPVTAWALRLSAGTALLPDALKLSAAQVRLVPAPTDPRAWDDGADRMQAAQEATDAAERAEALLALGEAMVAAYAVADGERLLAWWADRLGRRVAPGRSDIGEVGR